MRVISEYFLVKIKHKSKFSSFVRYHLITLLLRYNSPTTQFIHLKCTNQYFSVYALSDCAITTILDDFQHLTEKRLTYFQLPPFPPNFLSPKQHLLYFLSLCNHDTWLLRLISFTQPNVFEIHPHCTMYQNFILF